jgi:superfamily I DNA/RNA helicase
LSTEFRTQLPEYAIFDDYLDYQNLQESLKTLFKKFNPNPEFDALIVNVMSIHKSKGLQADYVFITGLVDGVMPNKVRGLDTIEAQRRVLFVGMTRAIKCLYMISQVEWDGKYIFRLDKAQFQYNFRKKIYFGKASSFITEMKQT